MAEELDDEELQAVLRWIDKIPLSRPKRNIARDFSDGVLMSEVVAHFFPKMVELHNYIKTNNNNQKKYNWDTLNKKVFKKMGFAISQEDIAAVVDCERGAIERILRQTQLQLANFQKLVEQGLAADSGERVAQPAPAPAPAPVPVAKKKGGAAAAPPAQQAVAKQALPNVRGGQQTAPAKQQQQPAAAAPQLKKKGSQGAAQPPAMGAAPRAAPAAAVAAAGGDAEAVIADLHETIDILQLKVEKLEQLLKLKNTKIATLSTRLEQQQTTQQQMQLQMTQMQQQLQAFQMMHQQQLQQAPAQYH